MDANHTYMGRCGEDTPVVSIPTSTDPLPCFDAGVIKDWETVVNTWWRGMELLEISPSVRSPTPPPPRDYSPLHSFAVLPHY